MQANADRVGVRRDDEIVLVPVEVEIDARVNAAVPDLGELLDIGVPAPWVRSGEIVAAPGKQLHARSGRLGVGAGETDIQAVYAKTSTIQKREGVRAGAANETHIVAGLAYVRFECQGQLRRGERVCQKE